MARNSSSNQQEHCDEGISIRDKDVVQTSKQHEMNEMEALNTPADQVSFLCDYVEPWPSG